MNPTLWVPDWNDHAPHLVDILPTSLELLTIVTAPPQHPDGAAVAALERRLDNELRQLMLRASRDFEALTEIRLHREHPMPPTDVPAGWTAIAKAPYRAHHAEDQDGTYFGNEYADYQSFRKDMNESQATSETSALMSWLMP